MSIAGNERAHILIFDICLPLALAFVLFHSRWLFYTSALMSGVHLAEEIKGVSKKKKTAGNTQLQPQHSVYKGSMPEADVYKVNCASL
jgi:hypothetical protein